jgi:hypothetical protein
MESGFNPASPLCSVGEQLVILRADSVGPKNLSSRSAVRRLYAVIRNPAPLCGDGGEGSAFG